ncbi:MAG: hypothetical protein AAGC68_03700, partial [Verrucomicrobiota bacterium]
GEETVATRAKDTTSYFLIGNSLTWDTVPSKLDGDVQWHVDCGKSLPFMYENPQKPCVKTSTLWPEALESKQYDFLSLQIHYGSTLDQDLAVVASLIDLQPDAVVVIHTGWARSESRIEEYKKKTAEGRMQHSPAYFQVLLERLRQFYPDREFRLTHAQDLLHLVGEDVAAGDAPFERIEEIYRDAIHMNTVTGRYLMHNAMRAALGQPRSAAGFPKLPAETREYLDTVLDRLTEIREAQN